METTGTRELHRFRWCNFDTHISHSGTRKRGASLFNLLRPRLAILFGQISKHGKMAPIARNLVLVRNRQFPIANGHFVAGVHSSVIALSVILLRLRGVFVSGMGQNMRLDGGGDNANNADFASGF